MFLIMLFLLLFTYKIGGLLILFQSIFIIILSEYVLSYDPDNIVMIWFRILSYLTLYVLIIILINDLINIIIEKWA